VSARRRLPSLSALGRFRTAVIQRGEAALEPLAKPTLIPLLVVGCLVVLTALTFVRQLLGHWTFPWDFLGPYTASPPFVASTIGAGHPLSWSPFVASGFPVDVNPQAGIYFPLWWVFGALGVSLNLTALTAVQVAHVCFGGLGIVALARSRRLAWSWATVAAVAYLFFGGFYGESEHADIFRGFTYLPWLLWTLTPPPLGRPWIRLALVPLLIWLIATGAYPGQLPAFGIIACVYLAVALRQTGHGVWRRHRSALLLAVVTSMATCVAVLLPYLLAQHRGELIRVVPATAPIRALGSFGIADIFGLYLNSFAWHHDGSVTAWSVGVPVLIGLVFVTRDILRRQLPLVAGGAVALTLATAPKIGLIGRAMVALGPLFPSRFPAADYKPAVIVALVVLSAEGWSELVHHSAPRIRLAAAIGGALVLGAVFAPSTYAPATQALWLLVSVTLVTVAVVRVRPGNRVLVLLLIALISVDGIRAARSYLSLGRFSAWQASPASVTMYRARDAYISRLTTLLTRAAATRPARIPPSTPDPSPTGNDADSAGWVADGYRLTDYFSTIERVRWQATHEPAWSKLLLERWHAYVYPCPASGCALRSPRLPPPSDWRPSTSVRTLSYGAGVIVYHVRLRRPAEMVENELAIGGWQASTTRARVIDGGTPLRTWRLAQGNYTFTARYQEPGRPLQETVAGLALLSWCALLWVTWRHRRGLALSPAAQEEGL
jgi:hypothetical protein